MVFGDKIKNRICEVLLINLIICLGLIFGSPNAYAESSVCKSPVDVVLVLDKSASMAGVKFALTKQAFSDFIYKESDATGLFATDPDDSYAPNDYHQIGLIGYNNNISSWALTQNYPYIISVINDPTGQFQNAVGSRNLTMAINQASGNLSANDNVVSPNIMIISLSGAPDDLAGAINAAQNAVNSGVRVVTVGIALNEILIAAQKQQAIDFIKNEYVYSGDCYYVTSSTEDSIADCNNVNQGALAENLEDFISQAAAAVCDETPPVIDSVIKTPPGTTYNVDKIRIISTAHDDSGFTEHYISWSDNWPNNQRTYDNCSLSGRSISCQTEEIGPFPADTLINFRSTVKDTNGNQATLDPPTYTKVATASISSFTVIRNKGNTITATISDPMGFATGDDFYIRVDNGTTQRVIDENNSSSKMTCAGTGLLRTCAYSIEPGCAADGSYVNNTVDVYVYAKTSGAFHAGGFIAKSLGVNIQNGTESSSVAGTCADLKDNDCDGFIDMEELQCDTTSPMLIVTRDPSGDVYDKTGTGVPQNITFTSQATDSNGIKKNIIIYREVSTGFSCDELSALNSKFICEDANMDGKCDSDASKLVGNLILDIGSKTAGTGISYCAEAFDWNNNEKKSSSYSFAVKSRECEGISDLGACNITLNAKCCAVVCDNTLTNPGGYTVDSDPNKTCAKQACNGMSWEYAQDRSGLVCRDSLDEDGCYELTTGSGGCEIRSYKCNAGKCLHTDNESWNGCDPAFSYLGTAYPLTWKVFQCNAASCELNPYPPDLNNPACDTSFDFITTDAYNSDSQLVAGSSGASAGDVHDNKTNKVKLKSKVNDARGVSFHKIYWKVNSGGWSGKDCGTCANGVECECLQEIGPFVVGDIVNFYVEAKDNSVNETYRRLPATAGTYYSFTARDSRCFDIPGGNKANMTSCEAEGGRCCGGICDTSKSNPRLYDNDCQNDGKCAGTSWEADIGNNGGACGSSEQCFWYYTGCFEGGNKCSSGFCSSVAESAKKVTTCWGANLNHLEDYACDFVPNPDECNNVNTDMDCSVAGTFDGDSVACNCNCGGYDVEEKFGSSLGFDGANDYVNLPTSLSVPLGAVHYAGSVAFWAKNGSGTPISIYRSGTNQGGYAYLSLGSGFSYTNCDLSSSPYCTTISSSSTFTSGNWNYFVFTSDGNHNYQLAVNGIITSINRTFNQLSGSYDQIKIGWNHNHTWGDSYFSGSIDDVRVYNRALYPEEIADHYNGVYFNNNGLVGYWNFNEASGETASDSSGNGYNGSFSNVDAVLYNGATLDNAGKYGKTLKLDGSDDYANIPSDLGDPSGMSLEFWFYVSEADKTRTQYFMDGRNGGNWWFLQSYNVNGSGNINFYDKVKAESADWTAGQWNHLILTADSSAAKIYINGELKSSGSGLDPDIGSNMRIGTRYINSNYFRGNIDEVRVYNRVISDAEAQDHHMGVFIDNTGLAGYWSFNSDVKDVSNNGPTRMRSFNDSSKNNAPVVGQVCTDGKNNDCDAYADEYDIGNAISDCDGELDYAGMETSYIDRNGDYRTNTSQYADIYNVDIDKSANDFTIEADGVTDDFGIKQTIIEWSGDSWGTTEQEICNNTGVCEVCAQGGSCSNKEINSSLLTAGNLFTYHLCAWDNSIYQNKKCTEDRYIYIVDANSAPRAVNPHLVEPHDYCVNGLGYTLSWTFEDDDFGDEQLYYEIQIKEGVNNDFARGPFVVNKQYSGRNSFYKYISGQNKITDFVDSATAAAITDSDKNWVEDEWEDGTISIISGTGAGQERTVESNTQNEIEISANWAVTPDNTSEYEVKSIDMEYDQEHYRWRVRVSDNRSGGYNKVSDWASGTGNDVNFIETPEVAYPDVRYSAQNEIPKECLSDAGGAAVTNCVFGDNVNFHDESIVSDCKDSDSSFCATLEKSKCADSECVACASNNECNKFDAGEVDYSCSAGVCIASGNCTSDSNCVSSSNSKCVAPNCVPCQNDSECSHIGSSYICNEGKCDDPSKIEWDFYGDTTTDSSISNPFNVYVESVADAYNVSLKRKDAYDQSCKKIKKIYLGGVKYPRWNEVSASSD